MSLLNPVHGSASYCITSRIGPLNPSLQYSPTLSYPVLPYPIHLHLHLHTSTSTTISHPLSYHFSPHSFPPSMQAHTTTPFSTLPYFILSTLNPTLSHCSVYADINHLIVGSRMAMPECS